MIRAVFYLATNPLRCRSLEKLLLQKEFEDSFGRESMRQDRADWHRRNGQLVRYWT